jgi:hypothetical protein
MLLVILVKLYQFWILDFEFWINSKLISQADSMSLGFFYSAMMNNFRYSCKYVVIINHL